MPHFSLSMNDVQSNGLTQRENNMAIAHAIPLHSMVRINDVDGYSGRTMFVAGHSRDCDGTPLYDLSKTRNSTPVENWDTHFGEECLTVIAGPDAKIFHMIGINANTILINDTIANWINSYVHPNNDYEVVPQNVIESLKEFITEEQYKEWQKEEVRIPYINHFQQYVERTKFALGHTFKNKEEAITFAKNNNIAIFNVEYF